MRDIEIASIRKLASFLTEEKRKKLSKGVGSTVSSYVADALSMKVANIAKNLISEEMGIGRLEEGLIDVKVIKGYPYFDGTKYKGEDDDDSRYEGIYDREILSYSGGRYLPKGPLWRSYVCPVSDEYREFALSYEFPENDESAGPFPGFHYEGFHYECESTDADEVCCAEGEENPVFDIENLYGYLCSRLGRGKVFGPTGERLGEDSPELQAACMNFFKFPMWTRYNQKVREMSSKWPWFDVEASDFGTWEDNELFWLEHVGAEFFEAWRAGKESFTGEEEEVMAFYEKAMKYMLWECYLNEDGSPMSDSFLIGGGGGQGFSLINKDCDGHTRFLITGYVGVEVENNYGYAYNGQDAEFFDRGLNRLSPQFIVATELIDSVIRWFDERYDFIPDDLYLSEETEEDKKVAV